MLEVLGSGAKPTFNDHPEVDYDLRIAIIDREHLNMPQPLLDRMETIRIPGYNRG